MSITFQDKMNQLRQVKGVSKKKLKAQEYNLRRKMGICFRCVSTNHTHAKCPEMEIKHENKEQNICVPHGEVEATHHHIELPSQQKIEACTEHYDEKSDMEVDKIDNMLLDNLLETLGPSPKVNTQWEINGEEIGNQCQFVITESQKNIQDTTTNPDVIHNDFASTTIKNTGIELQGKSFFNTLEIGTGGVDTKNMSINTEKCLYISYTIINEDDIPLVIPRGIDPEISENLLPKQKKSTRKVGRPKKSSIGIKPTNDDIKHTNDALEIGTGVDSNKYEKCLHISYNIIDEDDIPLVIPRGTIPEISENLLPKKKKSTRKVGRPKKSTVGIKLTK